MAPVVFPRQESRDLGRIAAFRHLLPAVLAAKDGYGDVALSDRSLRRDSNIVSPSLVQHRPAPCAPRRESGYNSGATTSHDRLALSEVPSVRRYLEAVASHGASTALCLNPSYFPLCWPWCACQSAQRPGVLTSAPHSGHRSVCSSVAARRARVCWRTAGFSMRSMAWRRRRSRLLAFEAFFTPIPRISPPMGKGFRKGLPREASVQAWGIGECALAPERYSRAARSPLQEQGNDEPIYRQSGKLVESWCSRF